MNTTLPRIASRVTLFAFALLPLAAAQAASTSPTLAPVAGPRPPVASTALASFDNGMAALRGERWEEAAEIFTRIVNLSNSEQRGQARYGLAIALSQMGQEDQALQALEGTLADDSQLGKAVADLRGKLLLNLADKALAEQGSSAASRWLNQYARLTIQPDRPRYERLAGAGEVVDGASVANPSMVLRVGVLLPDADALRPVGDDILRGIQLGLKEFDGRRGTRLELLPIGADDAAGAKDAAAKLLAQKVDVVVGPLTAAAVNAAKDVLSPAHVPMLVLSSDRAVVGEGAFALNYLPAEQGRTAARLALAQGHSHVAGLVPSTPYGYEVYDAFQDETKRLGGTVVGSAFYNPKNNDLGATIRTMVGTVSGTTKSFTRKFDALFIPAPGGTLPLVASQLSYYDIDKPDESGKKTLYVGTALWQDPRLLTPAGAPMKGGLFAVPPRAAAFEDSFRAAFGNQPHPLAVLGYDAARILTDIAAEKQRTRANVADLLLRPEGFYGSGGFIRFDANGLSQRGLNVVKVGEQFEVVHPALNMAPVAVPAELAPSGRKKGWW